MAGEAPFEGPAPRTDAESSVDELHGRIRSLVQELEEATRALADISYRTGFVEEEVRRVADATKGLLQKVSFLTLKTSSLPTRVDDLDSAINDRIAKLETRLVNELKSWRVAHDRLVADIGALSTAVAQFNSQEEMSTTTDTAVPRRRSATHKKKATPPPNSVTRSWVKPSGNVCPTEHPVKATLVGRWFRVPRSKGYDAATVDRCYVSTTAAKRAGFAEATD